MNRRQVGPGIGLIAAVALAVSACGSATTATAGQPAEPSSMPAGSPGPPGAAGTVAAVTTADIQVQNPRIGQVRVTFSPSTSFTKMVAATPGDLVVGDCALAIGAPQPGGAATSPLTAASVLISQPTADRGCPAGGFGGQGRGRSGSAGSGQNGGGASPGTASGNPNRPPGAGRGRGATAAGKIISVNGASFVVQLGASTTTRSVTTTQTTAFTKTTTTDKSALAVGQCVTAAGPADDTGTVAASSISIRQPGPNGCQGGPGRAGRGAASGNGS